jgi:CRP-like cAMP-binding protein
MKMETRRDRVAQALSGTPLFAEASTELMNALTVAGRIQQLKRGEVLFQRGEPSDQLALLLSGKLRVSNATSAGREIVLSFIAPGGLAGEIAALDGLARTADVSALEPSEVFLLSSRSLLQALKGDDAAYLQIIRALCGKIRETSASLETNTGELLNRAAAGLLRLGGLHGKRLDFGLLIDLVIPQKDLGAYLNMTRENANRQLGHLRDEGLITIEESKIILLDELELSHLAEASSD